MSLPRSLPPTEDVMLSTGVVKVRGLTRSEAIAMRDITGQGVEAVDKASIAAATDTPPDEVEAWYATAANIDVDKLATVISRLSGLDEDQGKGGAEALPSANGTGLITSSLRPSV